MGNTATVKNTIPKPPTQCVIIRQNSNERGKDSMSVKIVAPVVENPDIVSKKASVKSGIYPLSKYGNVPNRENIIQHRVTTI
jgi:hypothetical protein